MQYAIEMQNLKIIIRPLRLFCTKDIRYIKRMAAFKPLFGNWDNESSEVHSVNMPKEQLDTPNLNR